MNKPAFSLKYFQTLIITFCLIFAGVSCALPVTATPATATPAATPIIPTVEVPKEVTLTAEVPILTTPTYTPTPTTDLEALPGLTGTWIDPDSSNGDTVSTIEWQNGTYVVTSVINITRGGNELKTSSWSNGVLTWKYCPADMQHCIIQNTVSLNGDTLTVNWAWSGGGNSGTSDLHRQS